jgi:cytochrome c oxidase subunit 3
MAGDGSVAVIEIDEMTAEKTANRDRPAFTGLISLAAATTMLLAALTSAYIVRRGLAADWEPLHLPFVLAGGVFLLVFSSLALETGRRAYQSRRRPAFVRSWFGGIALGMVFVMAQVYGWNQISRAGLSAAGSPAAAFLFVLTGTFVALVIGALAALIWIGLRIARGNSETAYTRLRIAAYYWHYLDCLWLYLVILFYIRS